MSRTEWGQMVDFLRANPWCSREEYLWKMTVAQVRLASMDFTHVVYGDKSKKQTVIDNADGLKALNDFGIPVMKK